MTPLRSRFLGRVAESCSRLSFEFRLRDGPEGSLAEVVDRDRAALFGAAPIGMWPFNRSISSSISADKEMTCRLLMKAGVICPEYVFSHSHAGSGEMPGRGFIASQLEGLSFPLVVKPNRGKSAEGLTFLFEGEQLNLAVAAAAASCGAVLIQRYIPGTDFRIYALRGVPVVVVERTRRHLVADGRRAAGSIVAAELLTMPQSATIEQSAHSFIRKHGNTIFPAGEKLEFYPASNISAGGSALSVLWSDISRWNGLCETVWREIGLEFFAADCRVSSEGTAYFLEANSNPAVEMLFGYSKSDGARLMDTLVKAAMDGYCRMI